MIFLLNNELGTRRNSQVVDRFTVTLHSRH